MRRLIVSSCLMALTLWSVGAQVTPDMCTHIDSFTDKSVALWCYENGYWNPLKGPEGIRANVGPKRAPGSLVFPISPGYPSPDNDNVVGLCDDCTSG